MCLSSGLDIKGMREMGLRLLRSDKSLVLGTGTTLAILSVSGMTFCSNHRLSMYVNESTVYGRARLSR